MAGRYAVGRRHSEATTKSLKQDQWTNEFDLELATLPPEQSQGIIKWMMSPSLNHLTLVIASHLVVGKPLTPQVGSWEEIHDEFAASLNLSLPILSKLGDETSRRLFVLIVGAVTTSVSFTMDMSGLNPESKAMAIRTVAASAAARTRNSRVLGSLDDIVRTDEYVRQFRGQIAVKYRTMALPHAGTTRRVSYEELFVAPKLRWAGDDSEKDTNKPGALGLELGTTIESSLRTVILGDPGGGKSTLSRKLAYDLAVNTEGFPSDLVPLHVVLRDYSESFSKNRISLKECLAETCKNAYALDPPDGTLEYLLLNSRAFVILDGLDELLDTSQRRKAVEAVENFALSYPTVPILITSRRVGYEDAALDPELFSRLGLINFSQEQVTQYAERWFALDESIEPAEQHDLASAFVRDSAYVAELRSNPLLLSLMCGIYGSERYIPANRPDLYRRCAELLFERWDKQRGITVPLKFDAHVRMALYSLALHLYEQPSGQSGLSRMGMVAYIKEFLWKKRFPDEADAENAAEQFIDYCTGRAWVLTDMGSDHYAFTHRTFLEYFAAQQLVRLHPSARGLLEVLMPHLARKEWELISQLALQTLGAQVEDGADNFIRMALNECGEFERGESRSIASFCSRSLNFIVPSPEVIRLICSTAVFHVEPLPVDRRIQPAQLLEDTATLESASAVLALRQCSIENLPLVMKYLGESLVEKIESSSTCETELCLAIYLRNPVSPDDGMRASELSPQHLAAFGRFESNNRLLLRPMMREYADRYPWVAMELVEAGEMQFADTVVRHGILTLYSFDRGGFTFDPPFSYRAWHRLFPSRRKADREQVFALCQDVVDTLADLPAPWILNWNYQLEFLFQGLSSARMKTPVSKMNTHHGDALLLTSLPMLEYAINLGESGQFAKFFRSTLQARVQKNLTNAPQILEGRSAPVAALVTRWMRGDVSLIGPDVVVPGVHG
jgi:hypothetical protein